MRNWDSKKKKFGEDVMKAAACVGEPFEGGKRARWEEQTFMCIRRTREQIFRELDSSREEAPQEKNFGGKRACRMKHRSPAAVGEYP